MFALEGTFSAVSWSITKQLVIFPVDEVKAVMCVCFFYFALLKPIAGRKVVFFSPFIASADVYYSIYESLLT